MKTIKTFSRRIAALLLVVTVGITALAPAASAANIQLPSLPKDQCVVDDAGVLSDSTTSELETLNAQLSSSCDGAQIGVLTVDYTGSATTEDYATEAFNTWGIGSSSKNNGVLILLVMQSDQYADGDSYLTYGDGFRSTMLADQASSLVQTMEDDFAAKKYDAAVLTCATNVANTIAEVYGVTLSGGTIYSDGSDTQTTRPSVEPVPPQKHYSIWENFIGGIFSMLAYIILFIAVFFIFITPLGHSFGWFWGPFGWFGARTARALEHVGIQRLEDGLSDVLRLMCADVVSAARLPMVVRDGHQTVLGEGILLVELVESVRTLLSLGHVPSIPPLLRFAHALQTAEGRPERRVVDRAPEVEGLFEKTILLIVDPKRNFDDEGRSGGSHEDNYTSHETSKRLVPLLK